MTLTPQSVLERIGRRKSLPKGYAYALGEGTGRFGLDSLSSAEMRIDEARMAVFIPYADGNARDGVGDLLEIQGIDHSRHQRNPIVLYDHGKEVTLPIGTCEDPDTKAYCVESDANSRTEGGWCFYYQGNGSAPNEHALFCEQLFDLRVKRLIRGGSLGYTITEANEIPEDYRTGTPKGLHLIRTKMLEFSDVVLPCNQDTVAKSFVEHYKGMRETARRILCLNGVCGKPLSPYLVKSLSAYAPARKKAVLGYEGKSNPTPPNEDPPAQAGYYKGVAAIRAKYKARCACEGKSGCECEQGKAMASYANTTDYKPGDRVAARELLRTSQGGQRQTFANAGDRLEIVDIEASGRLLVRNRAGMTDYYSSAQIRKTKAFGEIRKQWRSKANCGPGERSDLTGCTPADGETTTRKESTPDKPTQGHQEAAAKPQKPNRPIHAAIADAAKGHRQNMRAFLGKMAKEEYSPQDVADDVEVYLDKTINSIKSRYGAWMKDMESAVPKKYGADAILSPEWKDVKRAIRHAVSEASEIASEMADVVGANARYYMQPEKLAEGIEIGKDDLMLLDDLADKLSGQFDAAANSYLGDAIQAFKAAHPAVSGGKGLPDFIWHKKTLSLPALRKKYRPVSGVRRRLRKSSPGSAVIHVRQKDVDAMRGEAERRGVAHKIVGEVPGGYKLRLSGDDTSIDEVASLYGQNMRGA